MTFDDARFALVRDGERVEVVDVARGGNARVGRGRGERGAIARGWLDRDGSLEGAGKGKRVVTLLRGGIEVEGLG